MFNNFPPVRLKFSGKDSAKCHAFKPPQASADGTLLLNGDFEGDVVDESVWNTCHGRIDDGCTVRSDDELEWCSQNRSQCPTAPPSRVESHD